MSSAQYFLGEAYWLCGKYWQRRGKRLHRMVWEHHHGPVPKGHHVHHIDGDRSNNDISNLECLPCGQHISLHMRHPSRAAHKAKAIAAAQNAAKAWHASPEGRAWHAEQGRRTGSLGPRFACQCKECGASFLAKNRVASLCSSVCKGRSFRRTHPGYYSKRWHKAGL